MLPPNLYQKGLAMLDETLLRMVEIKAAYTNLLSLHQQTIRVLHALVGLNSPDVDKILGDAQLVISDENGRQIFPRSGNTPAAPTVIFNGAN